MIIYTLLRSLDIPMRTIFWIMLLFALISPLGYWVVTYLAVSHLTMIKILCVVIGLFLHVSTSVIFETSTQHQFDSKKFMSIVIGLLLGATTIYITHGHLHHDASHHH